MKFFNSVVRKEFHLLEIERQQALAKVDEALLQQGQEITILFVERWCEKSSEITIRIDKIDVAV